MFESLLPKRDNTANLGKPLGNEKFKSRLEKSIMRMKTQNNLAGIVAVSSK